MTQDDDHIRALLRFHFQCLQGTYFSEYIRLSQGSLLFSDKITDPYYNFFAPEDPSGAAGFELVSDEFARRNRGPAVYLTPLAAGSPSPEGWEAWGTDTWMIGSAAQLDHRGSSVPGLSISEIGIEKRDAYLDAFDEAYAGDDPDDPYGQLESGYREGLSASFEHTDPAYKKYYALAEIDGSAVAVASLFTRGNIAGVYGVGTIPAKRGAGIGSAIMARLARLAHSDGALQIFLQTEADSKVERWYQSLGYTNIFHASYLTPATSEP